MRSEVPAIDVRLEQTHDAAVHVESRAHVLRDGHALARNGVLEDKNSALTEGATVVAKYKVEDGKNKVRSIEVQSPAASRATSPSGAPPDSGKKKQ